MIQSCRYARDVCSFFIESRRSFYGCQPEVLCCTYVVCLMDLEGNKMDFEVLCLTKATELPSLCCCVQASRSAIDEDEEQTKRANQPKVPSSLCV